jgi:hypothetical protein
MWKTSRGASAGALLKTRRCIPTSTQLASSVGTYLYGRRMYETMVYWETAHTVPNQPQFVLEWARQWQAAEKIVYSRTLAEPRSVRRLKADVRHDITVDDSPRTRYGLVLSTSFK